MTLIIMNLEDDQAAYMADFFKHLSMNQMADTRLRDFAGTYLRSYTSNHNKDPKQIMDAVLADFNEQRIDTIARNMGEGEHYKESEQ